jgi:hypothetical protein
MTLKKKGGSQGILQRVDRNLVRRVPALSSQVLYAHGGRGAYRDDRHGRNLKGARLVEENGVSERQLEGVKIHTPGEIAERVGGITIKTLNALIRSRGLETTTLGYAPPSPKGGPPRRLWGMTDAQLEALLALRKRGV